MKKIIYLSLLVLATGTLLAKTDLPQAIQKGIQRDMNIHNWSLEEKIHRLEKRNAEARRWFALNMAASYYYVSEQMRIQFPDNDLGNGIVIPGANMVVGAKNNYDFKLALSQPIFSGNRISNSIKSKAVQMSLDRENARLQALDTATLIKQSYFTHRLLIQQREATTAFIKTLSLHLDKLSRLFEEELVHRGDVLETEARLEEQKLLLEDVKDRIAKGKITFITLCAIDVDEVDPDYSESVPDLETAMAEFRVHHPIIKGLKTQISLLDIKKNTVNGAYLPQIHGFAELHYAKPGVDIFTNEWMLYFQGGLTLGLKIFDWNKRKRDIGIIGFQKDKQSNRVRDFIRTGDKNLKQLFSSKAVAEAKLGLTRNLLRIAEEESRLKHTLFLEQQLANIDYLAALSTWDRYRWKERQLLTQIEMIKMNIRKVIGRDNYLQKEEK